jgi:glycerol-3-phosphate dehydrogenase
VGLYSVIGGKLSTFRPLAREAIDHVGDGVPVRRSKDDGGQHWRSVLATSGLDLRTRKHLRVYGDAAAAIIAGERDVVCPHSGAVRGEVAYVVSHEAATSLSDILLRRTGIAWGSCRGLCCHREVARVAGELLGWGAEERERQVRGYERDVNFHLPALHCVEGTEL